MSARTSPLGAISLQGVWKIFAPTPAKARTARTLADEGVSRTDIQSRTGATVALRDISLSLPAGEISVIMGLSGSGKSTLLRLINRLIEPSEGTIRIDEQDVGALDKTALRSFRRERTAMVFQSFALLPHKSVIDNVAYALDLQGKDKAARRDQAQTWVEAVGLSGFEHAKPHTLSGGMAQRVGLARALAGGGDILLMDEPFSALDPLIRRDMQDLLLSLQSRLGKTVVFITHDLAEALRLGSSVTVLSEGAVEQSGAPEEIVFRPGSDLVRNFVKDVDRGKMIRVETAMSPAGFVIKDDARPFTVVRAAQDRADDPAGDPTSAVVVDKDRSFVGMLTISKAKHAAGESRADLGGLIEDGVTIAADRSLEEAFGLALTSAYPLAVLAPGSKRLVGVLSKDDILRALAGTGLD